MVVCALTMHVYLGKEIATYIKLLITKHKTNKQNCRACILGLKDWGEGGGKVNTILLMNVLCAHKMNNHSPLTTA